jgi:hypothetical protein
MMKFSLWLILGVAVAAAACTSPSDTFCDTAVQCPNADKPYCDLKGLIGPDKKPNTCIEVKCTVGDFAVCDDRTALTCAASGEGFEPIDCPNGCDKTNGCKACVTGAERCSADGVLVCGASGLETIDHTCPNGCTNATCNACVPGAERCGDHDDILHCDPDGTESVKQTCGNGCYAAACKACATGALACGTNGELLECDDTGVMRVQQTCGNGCYNGACKTCAEGAQACDADGNVVECNAMGVMAFNQACVNGCYNAACKTCATGALSCSVEGAGGDLLQCDDTGAKTLTEDCVEGCKTGGPGGTVSHCSYLQPKYLPDVCDTPSTNDLTISADTLIDPGIVANCNGGMVVQTAPDAKICVMHYKNISVAANTTLTLRSMTGFPAVALVADSVVDVKGKVDASAVGSWNGPGGGILGGGFSGAVGTHGGAGGATLGGTGCSGATGGGTVPGGGIATDPVGRVQLRGGDAGGAGGGGGGGITLIACRGALQISGTVMVNGGGGPGSFPGGVSGGLHYPPTVSGGGGAGGVVVLQGMSLNITGEFYANGGGGGANASTGNGEPGFDGQPTTTRSQGGAVAGSPLTFVGGYGGALSGAATGGTCGTPPGSGGGSVGFFAAYAPVMSQVVAPTNASPKFPLLVNASNTR